MTCSIHLSPPADFSPDVEVSSCYCEWQGKLLILKRHPRKSHGSTWGVPAGKLEKGENPSSALIREIKEEIGLTFSKEEIRHLGTLYIQYLEIEFTYYMFHKPFEEEPAIQLGLDEHVEFKWVTIEEALQMPLMPGEPETLEYFQKFKLVR